MADFLYKNIVNEFKDYLDSNLIDSIYFESLRIKDLEGSNIDFAYKELIRNEKFTTSKLLDFDDTLTYINQLRRYGKIKEYQKYCLSVIDSIDEYSELNKRVNTIQAISSNWHLQKKDIFIECQKEYSNFPLSVKVSFNHFDIQFSDDPFESLDDLLTIVRSGEKYQNLYFNFVRYYLTDDNIHYLLTENIKDKKKSTIAYITSILYIFFIKSNKRFELSDFFPLIDKVVKKISREIPDELDQKFNIVENITSQLSVK